MAKSRMQQSVSIVLSGLGLPLTGRSSVKGRLASALAIGGGGWYAAVVYYGLAAQVSSITATAKLTQLSQIGAGNRVGGVAKADSTP